MFLSRVFSNSLIDIHAIDNIENQKINVLEDYTDLYGNYVKSQIEQDFTGDKLDTNNDGYIDAVYFFVEGKYGSKYNSNGVGATGGLILVNKTSYIVPVISGLSKIDIKRYRFKIDTFFYCIKSVT